MLKIESIAPKVAKSDIKCWVVLKNNKLETPWPEINKISTIGKGYAYLGLYSFKHKEEIELFESILKRENVEIKEACIPEGSKYYEGTQGWSFPVSKEHLTVTRFCSNVLNF